MSPAVFAALSWGERPVFSSLSSPSLDRLAALIDAETGLKLNKRRVSA